MRILYVISGLATGGAERQLVLLARELCASGHQVLIYALNHETSRLPELHGSSVEVIFDQKRMRLDLAVLARLRAKIVHWRPTLIHGFLYDGNLYSRLAAVGTGIAVLGSERSDNYALSLSQKLGYRFTHWMCAGVVANSFKGAEFASSTQHVPPERCYVVWNGIDLAEVDRRLALPSTACEGLWPAGGHRRLCMVGAIKEAKDYPLALRTMRALVDKSPEWRLVCVGDELTDARTEEKSKVLEVCRRLGLDAYVTFLGRRKDVLEVMRSADVLIVTSNREGFPNVVLEAMASGTPVISTEYSDIRKILPNAWQVVATRDPEELANAILRVMDESESVAAAQRCWVETTATMSASTQAMLAVYRNVVTSSTGVAETSVA